MVNSVLGPFGVSVRVSTCAAFAVMVVNAAAVKMRAAAENNLWMVGFSISWNPMYTVAARDHNDARIIRR